MFNIKSNWDIRHDIVKKGLGLKVFCLNVVSPWNEKMDIYVIIDVCNPYNKIWAKKMFVMQENEII